MAPTFTDILRTAVATLQAAHPERLGEIARAHAAIIEGHVVRVDDANGKVLSRNGHTWYNVNGVCNCEAASFGKPCRHLSAWKLFRHVERQYDALQVPAPAPQEPPAETPAGIDPRFITYLHGKPFVRYAGLLALAHDKGLVSLKARLTSVSETLALADAEAVFADGRTFVDAADATPANVPPHIRPHFPRMALTRAKARCLRDALNIGICTLEELGEDAA